MQNDINLVYLQLKVARKGFCYKPFEMMKDYKKIISDHVGKL